MSPPDEGPLRHLLRRLILQRAEPQQQRAHARLAPSASALAACSLRAWQAAQGQGGDAPLLQSLYHSAGSGGARAEASGASSSAAAPAASTGGGDARFALPCVLRPAVGPKGLDLQLRLFSLHVGDPWEQQPSRRGASSSTDSSGGGGFGSLRRRRTPPPAAAEAPPILAVLDRAAGLLAARLLFAGVAQPALRLLAAAHCASAAVQATGLLLPPAAWAVRRLQRATPLGGAAAKRLQQLGGLAQQYGEPAFVLLAAAVVWATLHPSSQQIGECIAGEPGCCAVCAVALFSRRCWPTLALKHAAVPACCTLPPHRSSAASAGRLQPDCQALHPAGPERRCCRGGAGVQCLPAAAQACRRRALRVCLRPGLRRLTR